MNKKLLFSLFAVFALVANAYSQSCTPGTQTVEGFYPPAPATLTQGTMNIPYSQTIEFKVREDSLTLSGIDLLNFLPEDLTLCYGTDFNFLGQSFNLAIEGFEITGVRGLPPGFTFLNSWCGGTSDCTYNAGDNGCININGVPPTWGDSSLTILGNLIVSAVLPVPDNPFAGSPFPLPFDCTFPGGFIEFPLVDYIEEGPYQLSILNTTSVNNEVLTDLNVYPQPVANQLYIDFNANSSDVINVEIFDIMGKKVFFQTVDVQSGYNHLISDISSLSNGIYVYVLTDNNRTTLKSDKIIVSK